ncbi:LOW QUALITY PROTEIN: uncharacterized protein M8220_006982 [Acridotheres tristis]
MGVLTAGVKLLKPPSSQPTLFIAFTEKSLKQKRLFVLAVFQLVIFADSSANLTEKVELQCTHPKKKAVIIQTSWMQLNVTHKENTAVLHPVYGTHTKDAFEVSEKQNNPMFTKPGGNVAFTCPYKIGDSVQEMWERIKADWVDIVILCNSSGKQSFGSDFKECPPVDCSDQETTWDHKWFITYIAEGIFAAVLVLDFLLIFCITSAHHKKVTNQFA